jgi:hypothetical protein
VFVLDWTALGVSIGTLYLRRDRSMGAVGGLLSNRRREFAILRELMVHFESEDLLN